MHMRQSSMCLWIMKGLCGGLGLELFPCPAPPSFSTVLLTWWVPVFLPSGLPGFTSHESCLHVEDGCCWWQLPDIYLGHPTSAFHGGGLHVYMWQDCSLSPFPYLSAYVINRHCYNKGQMKFRVVTLDAHSQKHLSMTWETCLMLQVWI